MAWAAAAKLALKAAPALISLFGNRKAAKPRVDVRAIVDRYRGLKPTGYLTAEDTKFADTNFQRGAETVGTHMRSARSRAAGRLAAKGLSLSPASERVMEDLNQQESGALMDLNRQRDTTLYGLRTGREAREANTNLQGMLAEISGEKYNNEQANAQRAGFYNSILELAPEVFDYFGSMGKPKPGVTGDSLLAGMVSGGHMNELSTAGESLARRPS